MRKLFAAPLFAAALLLAACSGADNGGNFAFHSPGGQTEIFYEEADRKPLAGFEVESLLDEGQTIALSDFEGEIVVLNAWGQWCAPCRAEAPDLVALHHEYQDRAQFLGVNLRDQQPTAEAFERNYGVDYPSASDLNGAVLLALSDYVPPQAVPTTLVLDEQGRVAARVLQEYEVAAERAKSATWRREFR